jgi:WS/DGAT/MGAT family acyltransferase
MHLAQIFHRKLAFLPFDLGHPLWVEADKVDLAFHIRSASAKPLTAKQVEAQAAKLHGQLIDRSRPLWEFHIFEHVKPPAALAAEGGRFVAFYSKIHHAALDGKGGTVLANAILDLGETPREVPPPEKKAARQDLKIGEMVGAVFSNSLAQYAKLARSLPSAAVSLGSTVARNTVGGKGKGLRAPLQLAPKTMFNVGITGERAFATASVPFAEARLVAKAVGGSFNDVVLWLCATALRGYLQAHGGVPRKPMVAAMPVSLREENNKELNNQASMSLVQLGTHVADPVRRMAAIMASTAKVKQALGGLKGVLPTDYPSLLAPWVVGGAARAALKTYGRYGLAEKLPMVANLAISNVPGPQVPLYLAGARMLTFHPLSIVMHGLALNITIQTYAGRVDFGLIAGRDAVPQLQNLAARIETAFDEARQVFVPAPPAEPAAKPAGRKAAARKPAAARPRANPKPAGRRRDARTGRAL